MVDARGIARLGTLAVGLGIGAAMAHSPVAAADSSNDWLPSIDSLLSGGAVAAPSTPTLDLAISFNGTSLIHDGSAVADSGSAGDFNLAIAYGNDSFAAASGGTGNFAYAAGTDSGAEAGAEAGSGNNFNSAIDIGTNTEENDNVVASDGSFNRAIQIGNNTGSDDGSEATSGNHDTAIQIGNNTGNNDGSFAGDGNSDSATQMGSNVGSHDGADASTGNSNVVIDDGNYNGNYYGTFAGDGNSNFADSVGNQSESYAGGWTDDPSTFGNNNVAYVLDPFGTDGSYAEAGSSATTVGNSDVAAIFFTDDVPLIVTGVSHMIETLPSLF